MNPTNKKLDIAILALCRQIVMIRDGGKCRVVGCNRTAQDTVHIFDRDVAMLRYDLSNLYAGCRQHHNHDHPNELNAQHIEIIGTEEWERLFELSKQYRFWRYPDLMDIKERLTAELKILKEGI